MFPSKTIRCAKCQVEMSVRQFVKHRTGNGAPCGAIPCPVCGGAVAAGAALKHGQAVCPGGCQYRLRGPKPAREAVRQVEDQLTAMRRAKALPAVYQRRTRAG